MVKTAVETAAPVVKEGVKATVETVTPALQVRNSCVALGAVAARLGCVYCRCACCTASLVHFAQGGMVHGLPPLEVPVPGELHFSAAPCNQTLWLPIKLCAAAFLQLKHTIIGPPNCADGPEGG